jgi:sulfate adenylyltransferase subunit 2
MDLSFPAAVAAEPAPEIEARAPAQSLTHLDRLEAESIHIMREVVAECAKPVLLYSIGKDSSVLLHLAMKAFAPGKLPFPLLHVDTTRRAWRAGFRPSPIPPKSTPTS